MSCAVKNYELPKFVSSGGKYYAVARAFLSKQEIATLNNMVRHRGLDSCFHHLRIDSKYSGSVLSYVYARKTRVLPYESIEQLIDENMRRIPYRGRGRCKEIQASIDKKLKDALTELKELKGGNNG